MSQPIYPKKSPGTSHVRTSPQVNNGTVNNVLLSVRYGQVIGRLTGKVTSQKQQNVSYAWFEVRTSKGEGWIREDAFSFKAANTETQLKPEKERARIAQAKLEATAKKLQSVGLKLTVIGKNASKLTPAQVNAMQAVRQSYLASLSKLNVVTGNGVKIQGNLKGLGIVWTVPLILAVGSILAPFAAFVIDRAMKWYVEDHQIDSEAQEQHKVIDSILNLPVTTPEGEVAQVKALEKLGVESEKTQQNIVERQASTDITSTIKQIGMFAVVGFIGLELFKASRSK